MTTRPLPAADARLHWTEEELDKLLGGILAADQMDWMVLAADGAWTVWKGLRDQSQRLYRSPRATYFLGDIHDAPPYRDTADAETVWGGSVWPRNQPGDTPEFRRDVAAQWLREQGHFLPEELCEPIDRRDHRFDRRVSSQSATD